MIFLRCTFLKNLKAFDCDDEFVGISAIQDYISARIRIPANSITLFYNGKRTYLYQRIPQNSSIDVCLSIPGGKGGFGSMLRAIGAQIEKTTNREACRDLSGRRLRDINEEQRLKRWLSKKAEREADQIRRRKERLERLKELPKHEFHDPEYNKKRSELPERIDDALSQGLKKSSILGKKSGSVDETDEPPSKRKWLDNEMSSDSDECDRDHISRQSLGESSKTDQTGSSDSTTYSDGSKSPIPHEDHANNCPMESSSAESLENEESNSNKVTESEPIESISVPEDTQEQVSPPTQFAEVSEVEEIRKDAAPQSDHVAPSELKDEEGILDLAKFNAASELENLGLEKLKVVLTNLGLKCGGTLTERAQRLWSVRGMDPKDYPRAIKAKPKKS